MFQNLTIKIDYANMIVYINCSIIKNNKGGTNMPVREILKKSKIDLKGKKKYLLKPTIMYYLIFAILQSIFTLCITTKFNDVTIYDLSSLLDLGVTTILLTVIYSIVFAVINMLLNYGMAASITALKREEEVGFITLFKAIKEHGFKALGISLIYSLKMLGYIAIIILLYALTLLATFRSTMPIIIACTILLIVVGIFCLDKLILSAISARLANYLVYDFPQEKSKELMKKATEIAKKQQMTLVNTILINMLKVFPFIIVAYLLSANIDMFIWKPNIITFWGFVERIESTAPMWWNVFVSIFSGIVTVLTFLSVIVSTSAFYENATSEDLFGEEFNVKREKVKNFLIGLGLIILYIGVTLGVSFAYSAIYQDALENWINDSYNDMNKEISQSEKIEDIKIESVETTEKGDLVIKLANNAKPDSSIYVFYDDEIQVIGNEEDLYTEPNKKTYTHLSKYSSSYYSMYDLVKGNDTKYEVAQLKDNLVVILDGAYKKTGVAAVFYKNNKVVGAEQYDTMAVVNNKTYVTVDYPKTNIFSANYLEFDRYEIYFSDAEKEDSLHVASEYLKTKLLGIVDNKAIVELKNENKDVVYISDVYLTLEDKNNKLVDFAKTSYESYAIAPNDTIYVSLKLKNVNDNEMSLKANIACDEREPLFSSSYVTEKLKTTYTMSKNYTLEVSVENNLNKSIGDVTVRAVFLKDNKLVGFSEGKNRSYVEPGEKLTVKLDRPLNVVYDDVKVSVVNAYTE